MSIHRLSRSLSIYVAKNNNIIEINGKRFDASTGAALSHNDISSQAPKNHPSKLSSAVSKPTMTDVVRKTGKHIPRHAQKPAGTLMRHAVKKPSPSLKRIARAQGPADQALAKTGEEFTKKSAMAVSSETPSKHVKPSKNSLIRHFAPTPPTQISTTPIANTGTLNNETPEIQSGSTQTKPKTSAELLDHALRAASSHEQKSAKNSHSHKRRTVTKTVSGLAVLLLLFVGYQQIPSLKLNVASARAGFSASLPTYQPPGYSLGRLNYSSGVVSTNFKSNSDNRNYTLTQKPSTWNSQALRDNFVIGIDKHYQVIESGGRTIFLYNGSNATWVNGGIWYIVQGGDSLTSHQLVELATSI